MSVFVTRYLEPSRIDEAVDSSQWKWAPQGSGAYRIYASGNNTRTNQSTYADERDQRSDTDRPDEGPGCI